MKILITGANGQLGITLQDVLKNYDLILTDRDKLDITASNDVNNFVSNNKPDVIINAAAYTAVDKAEEEMELARKINVDGAKNLAKSAKNISAMFFHISTDFVFDGTSNGEQGTESKDKTSNASRHIPYKETDRPKPLSVYGQTKYDGEKAVQQIGGKYYILRTAWLYSPYGKNFVKTMIKLGQEKDELAVVTDQIGCPTYAYDLTNTIKLIIERGMKEIPYGLYHFAGEGSCSWFEFATKIIKLSGGKAKVLKTTAKEYGAPAARPAYSVLDCTKIKSFDIKTIPWQKSLKKCIDILKPNNLTT